MDSGERWWAAALWEKRNYGRLGLGRWNCTRSPRHASLQCSAVRSHGRRTLKRTSETFMVQIEIHVFPT